MSKEKSACFDLNQALKVMWPLLFEHKCYATLCAKDSIKPTIKETIKQSSKTPKKAEL